tara:strand:- start:1298 stop:1765 length:468 start_codon:yes stop_codon:yes gene_type:complete
MVEITASLLIGVMAGWIAGCIYGGHTGYMKCLNDNVYIKSNYTRKIMNEPQLNIQPTSMSKVADSKTLIKLCRDADNRGYNRRVITEELEKKIDPHGKNIINPIMIHNDTEWRCLCMIKLSGETMPVSVFLDVHPDNIDSLPSWTPAWQSFYRQD